MLIQEYFVQYTNSQNLTPPASFEISRRHFLRSCSPEICYFGSCQSLSQLTVAFLTTSLAICFQHFQAPFLISWPRFVTALHFNKTACRDDIISRLPQCRLRTFSPFQAPGHVKLVTPSFLERQSLNPNGTV